jgi:hypothetical protein
MMIPEEGLETVLILNWSPFGRVSEEERGGLSWFETAHRTALPGGRLLTMRGEPPQ